MRDVQVDGDRLWRSLAEMARIGATPRGGVCRLALTDEDRAGRDLFVRWCREAGCEVIVDRMGNIFARRPGTDPDRAPVLTGSHLDSQPTGGRFDGVYGVLAGLEAIRALNQARRTTGAPIEVAVWTNEEGSRFPPAMVASGVFAGVFDLEYGLSRADRQGLTLGQELSRIGYDGATPVGGRPLAAVIELHIEQGPVLEADGCVIGVVSGAQGQRWYEVRLTGAEAHAGPTPMTMRQDALAGAADAVLAVERLARDHAPDGRGTVGLLATSPNSRNTVPGETFLTVDLRHPVEAELDAMDTTLRTELATIAARRGLRLELTQIWRSPAVAFDPLCVEAIRRAATARGLPYRELVSGAGHDACYLSRVAPTSMIFIPCAGGVSHNEAEAATPGDVAAGAQVLLDVLLELGA